MDKNLNQNENHGNHGNHGSQGNQSQEQSPGRSPSLSVLPGGGSAESGSGSAIARLNSLVKERNLSLSQLAEMVDCSKTKISQVLNEKYGDKSEEEAKAILDRLIGDQQFITRAQQTIAAIFDLCAEDKELGVIVGPSGLGKTYTARTYAETHDQVFIYTPTELSTPTGVLRGLSQMLKLSTVSDLQRTLRDIQDTLSRSCRLLIVDEADVLCRSSNWEATKQKFAIFRQIMEAGIGVCLIGIFPLEDAINQMPGYFQNRIGYYRKFKALSKEDLNRYMDFFSQGIDSELKSLAVDTAALRGGFHYLSKVIKKGKVMGYREVMNIIFSVVR
ncbi:MAG: AAA family ATPase [bacterium]